MKSRYAQHWTFQIAKVANAPKDRGVLMFSCPQIGANILLTCREVKSVLEGKEYSSIPTKVLEEAYGQYWFKSLCA